MLQSEWELIIVDDDSPDLTAERAKQFAQDHDNIRVIRRVGRRGLSSACIEGALSSSAPIIAVMDADLQHDETILPALLRAVKNGADVAIGSRYTGEGSAGEGFTQTRLKGSQWATRISEHVTQNITTDPMSGFFALRRDLLENLAPHLTDEGFKILLDLLVTAAKKGHGLKVEDIPYSFRPREIGESKMSPIVVMQFAGLWISKILGGWLPPSIFLFSLVGFSGIAVHLSALGIIHYSMGMPFIWAQTLATIIAMTWNFWLNNNLTYADKKLHGFAAWRGLISFYLVCSLGALANVSVASVIFDNQNLSGGAFIAGFAGALMSSVFNYAVTRMFTWK